MFLSERRGEIKLPKLKDKKTVADLQQEAGDSLILFKDEQLMKKRVNRMIAEVEMVGGVEMISAFVHVKGGGFSAVEGLGAVMQTKFSDNLAAMMLPADKIEKIADLDNVIGIEVAEVLQPLNDTQRSVTQAGDAISNSAAAQALGLTKQYTGKNVILGIIDSGIDFQHIAFKDKNGNSRIVRAYKLSGTNSTNLTTYSSSSQISGLTYDTNTGDHGTHTSTTAGGSSVIVNGSTVTVTDDHANATYGGMAPEADLVIAGLSSLYTTSIGTAIQNICDYADQVGKPCVISLSLGSQVGPHDGTGTIASIVNQCAGNNHIIVYAASNDGMRADAFVEMGTSNGGGMYASGTSTSSKPMIVNVQKSFSDADGNYQLYMPTITAYARTANVPTSLKFHVVDTSTGNVVYSSDAYISGTTISLTGSTGLAKYFKSSSNWYNQYGDAGKIRIVRTQDSNNNKYYWQIYAPIMQTTSGNTSGSVYTSNYAFCVSVYPTTSGVSTIIDMWEGSQICWFGNDLTLSSTYANSYNLVQGNDECSVSDNACYSKVISVGAYVTKNSITDYNGTAHDYSSNYPNIGDHAYFSSWQTAGYGPLGTALPHINAPGARIVAGVNHYHTTSVDDYSYYGSDYNSDLVVNSASYPYAAMEGTSMATPCVSGIIAQWLQACVEAGKTPSPDYIKEVMQNTWDTDQWTNGAGHGAKTFGTHGKINAIKGIQYILGTSAGPVITATPTSVDFGEAYVGDASVTKTFNVKGTNLEGNVSLSLNDPSDVFSLSETSISRANATSGRDINVTFTPKGNSTYTATVTISSTNADPVTVTLNATGKVYTPTIAANPSSLSFTGNSGQTYTKTVTVTGSHLQGNITAAIQDDANGFYSVSPTSFNAASQTVTVTWAPTAGGTSTANLVLTTTGTGANTVTVPITGTAQGPTITATPTSVTFTGYATQTYAKTVTVTGTNLSQKITAAISGSNVYSIDNTSLGTSGGTITITWAPTAAGNTTATLTLSSNGASTVSVPINGTAQAATPTLIVSPSALSFTDSDRAKTFAVTGRFINEDVTLTLNDASGAFALGSATIPASSISETNAVNVTVNFTAEEEGDYTGTVTVASDGAASQTVNLNASISNGGTASDAYLNIAKYATIDEAGWQSSYVTGLGNFYKYTEYAVDGVAWLTLPVYGAWTGVYYNNNPQKWIKSSLLTTSNVNGTATWNASDIYLGSSSYFSSNSKYFGNTSTQANSTRTITFYVKNATAVKLLGLNGSRATGMMNTYPTTLNIYECTENADGTLTEGTTVVKSFSNATNNASINFEATDLDATKIYKVVAGTTRGYLYEIGFQTPLTKPSLTVDPTQVSFSAKPNETVTKSFTVTGKYLEDDVTITLTDENGIYILDKSSVSIADAEAGSLVSVTLNAPQQMGGYFGYVTLTSGSAQAKVSLFASVGDEGSAFSEYLDVVKYKTIGLNDWYKGFLTSGDLYVSPYNFTEVESDNCAWLTVPTTIAYFGASYNYQKWCGMYKGSAWWSSSAGWDATDVFPSSSTFYSGSALYVSPDVEESSAFSTNTTQYYAVFDVTNCSQVKAYGYNTSVYSSSYWSGYDYRPFMRIYELIDSGDGTFTASTTTTDEQISSVNNTTFTLTSTDLDPAKIYRVYIVGYRSLFYEMAFKTPLVTTEATLAEIERSGYTGNRYKIKDELVAVYAAADKGLLWCKDKGNASIAPTQIKDGQIDYMKERAGEAEYWQSKKDWDQSNWVLLKFPEPTQTNGIQSLLDGAVGKTITSGSLTGRYIDDLNYTIEVMPVNNAYTLSTGSDAGYVKNLYCTANFLESNLNLTDDSKGAEGVRQGQPAYYFFMNPKVQEVCEITYAEYDENNIFIVPDNDSQISGALTVKWDYNAEGTQTPAKGTPYRFVAVVKRTAGSGYGHTKAINRDPSSTFEVYPLNFVGGDGNIITAINGIYSDGYREVVGVDYVNVAGMVSDKPFQGVNIIVTRYSDGSRTTVKKVFK